MTYASTTFCAECHTIDGCVCVRGNTSRRNDPVRLLLSEIIGNGDGAGRNPQLMVDAAKKLRTVLTNSSRVPEPTVSMPPAADAGAPCTLADRVGTSATTAQATAQAAATMREAAARVCRHTREVVGAATGSSIAMALAEAEGRIRALPLQTFSHHRSE